MKILRELRQGTFDVLVGVNLLREGLDLPEVSLVAILDADKEGFLRSEGSLIQTMGAPPATSMGRRFSTPTSTRTRCAPRWRKRRAAARCKRPTRRARDHARDDQPCPRRADVVPARRGLLDRSTRAGRSEEIFEDQEALIAEIARLDKAMRAGGRSSRLRGGCGAPRPYPLPRDQRRAGVRGFWHPLSAVYLDRPRVLASPAVLKLMLAGEGRAQVVYAGDRCGRRSAMASR